MGLARHEMGVRKKIINRIRFFLRTKCSLVLSEVTTRTRGSREQPPKDFSVASMGWSQKQHCLL